jgi:hypothetical protein
VLRITALLLVVVFTVACSKGAPASDAWAGIWHGPEGTYLEITGSNGKYQMTIKDLDAARSFQAAAVDNGIEFHRDGVKEIIRPTDGVETGMKWLADKKDCLTVKPGEGYCRNQPGEPGVL